MRQANLPNLGVSNLAWAPEQTSDALASLARLGVRGVEAAPSRIAAWDRLDAAAVAEYRRRVEDAGLRLCSLQAILFGRPEVQLLADETAFLAMAEHMRRVAAIAHGLGAGVAVLGAPRSRTRGGLTMAAAEALAAKRLRVLGDIAEPAGLTIGLEPVPAQYGADFMLLAADVRRVVALCGHRAVRTHLDCACVMLGGGDIGMEVAATGAGLVHYHIAEPELGGFDAPVCAHGEAAAALAAIGYTGWTVIEMREQPDGLAAVERAVRFAQDTYCRIGNAAAEFAEMRE
jgi:sugar phosphate isomerase/epimerase